LEWKKEVKHRIMSGPDWKIMFKAVQDGDIEMVRYYLKMGINPNYQHPEIMAAPLVESIRFNHLNIAQLLLENGANPNIEEDMEGDTALFIAKAKKNRAAIDLLGKYLENNS